MQFALIKKEIVENVIVADTEFISMITQQWDHIEPLDTLYEQGIGVGIGWKYINGNFVLPEVAATTPSTKITRLAFLNRFTDAEAIAIDLAQLGETVDAAAIRRYQKKIDAASFIDLQSPETVAGIAALETIGLIALGRANSILNSPVKSEEIYAYGN